MEVAVLQMQVACGQPEQNIENLHHLADQAMEAQPDVLLLPELWLTGFYPRPIRSYADSNGQKTCAMLSALAQKYQVNLVGGTVPITLGDKVFNTSYIFDRQGQLVTAYQKTHLFSPSGEDRDFTAGEQLVTFYLDGIKCGILVCYDIRFPEAARKLALADTSLLFIPAAWPQKRLRHWQTLIRARAIENQLFVIACNAAGTDGSGQKLAGHSAIIDPWGETLAEACADESILQGTIQTDTQTKIRKTINVFHDRRPTLYKKTPN